ncbi:MAG: hypothetical protein J4G00_05630 [Actinomycetia bacterium]|nr:hypothetical protein [Actinomycetes bacterium]
MMTVPRLISRATAKRVLWGTEATGKVSDIYYHSDEDLHVIEFGLGRGDKWVHAPQKRTLFAADEVYHVLEGTLVVANPQTGEVCRVPAGHSVFFRKDTWHHGFAHRGPVRVIEFMAPTPAQGVTQAYARTQPYLPEEDWRYAEGNWEGRWPMERSDRQPGFTVVSPQERLWSVDDPRGILLRGMVCSTEHLAVYAAELEGDVWTRPASYRGTGVALVTAGILQVRGGGETLTVAAGDAVYLPPGSEFSYRSEEADFLLGMGHRPG